MPRGGRRPGASAPKGNLNALTHGRYSPIARSLLFALLSYSPYLVLRVFLPLLKKKTKQSNNQKREEVLHGTDTV